ncbi:MAG: purine-nucleoside phosphorylase [Oscillospiraceae bacterium]
MATPHIAAEPGQIAATVLMPGDPLRAKFIAENYLKDAREFSHVRGMLGYTGTHGGKPVSVMGSGMGMPSIGIYSWELFTVYGVQQIVRVGSAGAYTKDLELFDLLLVIGAYSESTFAHTQNGCTDDVLRPGDVLTERLRESAARLGKPLREGTVHCTDVFYQSDEGQPPYWQKLRDERGCLAVEMESFALFHNAQATGRQAACLLTISDSFLSTQKTTAEEREKHFTDMMEVALGVL